jgi:hypothetical protein
MKFSKVSLLFLIIGVFLIAIVGLGAVRSKQLVQQRDLNKELTTAQIKLGGLQVDQLTQKQDGLEKQLSDTMAQSKTDRELLSQPADTLAIGDTLFKLAQANGVEVVEVTSPGLTPANLEGVKCSALDINAKIKGDVLNLVNFIKDLNAALKTGIVKQVDITISPATTGGAPTANIQLSVYTYQEG